MTYDCRSVLKHVLKCCDIFSDVHNNRKSCRGPVVSRCRMRQSRTRQGLKTADWSRGYDVKIAPLMNAHAFSLEFMMVVFLRNA